MKVFLLVFLSVIYTNVYSQFPLSPNKQYENGVSAYKNNDYQTCITALSKFVDHPLRNKSYEPNAYYYRGLSFYNLDQYGKASGDFRTAIYMGVYDKDNANLHLGLTLLKLEKDDEALKAFSASIESGRVKQVISAAYFQRGLLKEKNGDSQSADEDFNLAVKTDINNAQAATKANGKQLTSNTGRGKNVEVQNKAVTPIIIPISNGLGDDLADKYKAEKRYALVVGNSLYPKEIGILKNPANDAQDISVELRKCGFEVDLLLNATHRQIEIAANNLFNKISEGPKDQTVGLFFYAGHGLQFEGTNYLVPVDASIATPTDVVYACYPMDKILGKMEFANSRMNIVILDACRSNPFPATTRSGSGQGLAQVRAAKGSYVAFATAPGSVASDGSGRNGLYTQELLKALRKPNTTIEQIFKEVRLNVSEQSGGRQSTWDNSNIIGDFYFTIKK